MLFDNNEIIVSPMTDDMFLLWRNSRPLFLYCDIIDWDLSLELYLNEQWDDTYERGTVYISGAAELASGFGRVCLAHSLVFSVAFSSLVLLFVIFVNFPGRCEVFFDLWVLNTPLAIVCLILLHKNKTQSTDQKCSQLMKTSSKSMQVINKSGSPRTKTFL